MPEFFGMLYMATHGAYVALAVFGQFMGPSALQIFLMVALTGYCLIRMLRSIGFAF